MAAPQDDVVADHIGHKFDDLGVARQIQEVGHAAHTFAVVAGDVGRDQFFRAHAGIQRQQRLQRRLQLGHAVRCEPEFRYHPARFAVLRDFMLMQMSHRAIVPPRAWGAIGPGPEISGPGIAGIGPQAHAAAA
jgi:hypothetical protein